MRIDDLALVMLLAVVLLAVLCIGWTLYSAAYDAGRSEPYWGDWDVVLDLDECTITAYHKGGRDVHTWQFDSSIVEEWLDEMPDDSEGL